MITDLALYYRLVLQDLFASSLSLGGEGKAFKEKGC